MARPTKEILSEQGSFPATKPSEKADETTRAAWEIVDAETEVRADKTARLRKARLEREASAKAKTAKPKSSPKSKAKPKAK